MKRILCVSAEPSGDQLLAPIIRELVALGAQPLGVGGEHSRQAGLELICHTDELSGAGIVEALPAIPRHVRTLARLKHLIPTVDALLVVDAPELGTRLLKNAHKCGLRTAYLPGQSGHGDLGGRNYRTVIAASFLRAEVSASGVPAVALPSSGSGHAFAAKREGRYRHFAGQSGRLCAACTAHIAQGRCASNIRK